MLFTKAAAHNDQMEQFYPTYNLEKSAQSTAATDREPKKSFARRVIKSVQIKTILICDQPCCFY